MTFRRFLKPFLSLALLVGVGSSLWAAPAVQAVLFTSPYCPHCRHLKQDGFPQQFREKHHPDAKAFSYGCHQIAWGLFKKVVVADAAATPGVLENTSVQSPMRKLHSMTAHCGNPRLNSMMKYTYSRGVAHPNRLTWLSTSTCTRHKTTNVERCLIASIFIALRS